MSYMKTLPVLGGTDFIVIDEGLDVIYARALIAGWCHVWEEETHEHSIDLLSFSDPRCWYENEPKLISTGRLQIHDYYTVDTNAVVKDDFRNLECILKAIRSESRNTVIVDCLSSLILYVGVAKTLHFIEELSKQVSQLICIYRRDLVQNKIPDIETLGTTYVKLEKSESESISDLIYVAKLSYRKLSGSIICQTELIKQDIKSYRINAEQIIIPKPNQANTGQPAKIESSFRIEINAREMEQRNKIPLPYTLNTANASKIFYQPDAVDDIDEDDPDDDLMSL